MGNDKKGEGNRVDSCKKEVKGMVGREYCSEECEKNGICSKCPDIIEVEEAAESSISEVRAFHNLHKKDWVFVSKNKDVQIFTFQKRKK